MTERDGGYTRPMGPVPASRWAVRASPYPPGLPQVICPERRSFLLVPFVLFDLDLVLVDPCFKCPILTPLR